MAQIIDGKRISAEIKAEIAVECESFKKETGVVPTLAVVLVGDDQASAVYVRNKKKACEECGFRSLEYILPGNTAQEELENLIAELNADGTVHGILVQLPLPAHLDSKKILLQINPDKDVDAFHPINVGKIMIGKYDYLPCTPAGVMELIKRSGIQISGKRCAVIGRSDIVGKPMAMLLLHANGTVTICHSKTENLTEECRRADIIVVAIGKAKFLKADMVKPGAVVIDVGMDRDENGKLCGDVDFTEVEPVAGYITPVPGGVGPMTVTMLMQNTLTAAKKKAAK